ncbi:ATP-binding protein [Streptosporangium soli]|nr:ATP-binding protein [Streptosporangium sp. KLBMP 9127]
MTEETRMRGGRSLAEALEDDLAQWSARTGIAVETWALPEGDVPPRTSRAVLLVFHEALSNVQRHSGAGTVSIAVTMSSSGLRMTISDDGVGFDPPVTGRGITAMRTAFAELGGSLTVTTAFGAGTTVTGAVPA